MTLEALPPEQHFAPRRISDTISNRPGVTIAIPNWNHELLLPRSLESALETIRYLSEYNVPAEVLIIDDHSRDGSLTLLRQLETLLFEEGVRVLALKQNHGLAHARNQHLLCARYRHVVFLDADNELIPRNIYHFYRAGVQTQAAIIYGNLIRLSDNRAESTLINNESIQPRIFERNYIDACALVDRCQILDSGGYWTTELIAGLEDWDFYLHLVTNGRQIVFVPLAFGIYYDLPGSMIKNTYSKDQDIRARFGRTYDQLKLRVKLANNTLLRRYHPDIGYL